MATDLSAIATLIGDADWNVLHPQLIDFADLTLRSSIGWSNGAVIDGMPCIEGRDAHWFLHEAIDKTLDGTRKWDPEKIDLYRHLSETMRSLINSHLTSRIVRDRQAPYETESGSVDPIDIHPDRASPPDDANADAEVMSLRREHILAFKRTLADDHDLTELFNAYDAEYVNPRDIAEVTSLSAERISELKRKLQSKYLTFTTEYKGPLVRSDLVRKRK